MREMEKIGLHSIYLLFGNISLALLSFAITIFITRSLGPADFGIYSFVISIFLFLSPIALLGLGSIFQRHTAFYYGKKDFGMIKGFTFQISKIILYSTLAIAISVTLVSISFPNFLPYTKLILISLPFFFLLVFYTLFSGGLLAGTRRFALAVFLDIFSKGILLSSLFVLIVFRKEGVILANTLSLLLPVGILFYFLRKSFMKVKTKNVNTKSTFSMSIQYFGAQTVFGILLYLNIFMLTFFAGRLGIEQVGFYSLASNIEFYFENFLMFIGAALSPAIIQYYGEQNFEKAKQAFKLGVKYTFLLAFPVLFSLVSTAEVLVSDIFTNTYSETIPILQVLAFSLLATMMLRLLLPVILAKNLVKLYLYFGFILLLITLPATFILSSKFSSLGAAFARVVPLILGTFLFTFLVAKKAKLVLPIKAIAMEFLFSSIFLLLFLVPRQIISVVVSFFVLFGVYIALLYITKIFHSDDLNRIKFFFTTVLNKKEE